MASGWSSAFEASSISHAASRQIAPQCPGLHGAEPSRPGDAGASRLAAVDALLREHAAGHIRYYGDIVSR